MREQIEGYAPLHHRWCTRHLVENLLRKDGVKDNFDLFYEAARQLEDKCFQKKLEQVRTTSEFMVDVIMDYYGLCGLSL